ncbi:hypothetical protein [Streptomyces sp. NPDC014685]|uniref:hypothetical protein n=1 Tax=Streptomyces sp. NPDC014685 TaxID=3364881 RepID=UPI0036FF3F54
MRVAPLAREATSSLIDRIAACYGMEAKALRSAIGARWWEGAYGWEREEIWPRRLHLVAGGDAGGDLE